MCKVEVAVWAAGPKYTNYGFLLCRCLYGNEVGQWGETERMIMMMDNTRYLEFDLIKCLISNNNVVFRE